MSLGLAASKPVGRGARSDCGQPAVLDMQLSAERPLLGLSRRRVCLLGTFHVVVNGGLVRLGAPVRRVIAYLALNETAPVQRPVVAEALWPDGAATSALVNLRQALRQERAMRVGLIESDHQALCLSPTVGVDLREATIAAHMLLHDGGEAVVDSSLFLHDLLPHWDESWLSIERERFRQLRLHCLEELSRRELLVGRPKQAVAAAHAAVVTDPLRESAQMALITALVAEGNRAQAVAQYRKYASELRAGLGLEPSRRLLELVDPG